MRLATILRLVGLILFLFCVSACNSSGEETLIQAPPIVDHFVKGVATVVEVVGIGVIVIGAIAATLGFFRDMLKEMPFHQAYHNYRSNLGRAILLGLEFLVAADIVGTVAVDPTFRNLGVLALIVLIRTFLSFALEVEISGHWPWKQSEIDIQSSRQDSS
jgi:uncharacterized membrane protein